MKPANNAPFYASIYAKLAEEVRAMGYALAIHGSLGRDFDLICIPWIERPQDPERVVDRLVQRFALRRLDGDPEIKHHGRMAYTMVFLGGWGDLHLDLQFMPATTYAPEDSPL